MAELVRYDEEEAVFKRSMAERLIYSVIFGGSVCFVWMITFGIYRGTTTDKMNLPLDFIGFSIVFVIFAFSTGPRDMRFDFPRKRYQTRVGFFCIAWTHAGDFREISHLNVWNTLKFTGISVEWKNAKRPQTTFVSCSTGSEAQALAERLAVNLGVPVKAGIVRGGMRPAK